MSYYIPSCFLHNSYASMCNVIYDIINASWNIHLICMLFQQLTSWDTLLSWGERSFISSFFSFLPHEEATDVVLPLAGIEVDSNLFNVICCLTVVKPHALSCSMVPDVRLTSTRYHHLRLALKTSIVHAWFYTVSPSTITGVWSVYWAHGMMPNLEAYLLYFRTGWPWPSIRLSVKFTRECMESVRHVLAKYLKW